MQYLHSRSEKIWAIIRNDLSTKISSFYFAMTPITSTQDRHFKIGTFDSSVMHASSNVRVLIVRFSYI